jgi:exodeoxyribonuclease V alpha subunit
LVDPADWPTDVAVWKQSLKTAVPLVGGPGERRPFILDGDRLFLARSLHEEEQIARRIGGEEGGVVRVLLGGPGTGKTTQVARRLVDRLLEKPDLRIALAAPTGKAAARMAEALRHRLHDPGGPVEVTRAPAHVLDAVAKVRPVTIHKLLGSRPHGTPRYRFGPSNPLAYDLVVVDETSMLSSSLMVHLLEALGTGTELLLVGDPDQLASVDAGTVLGDIASAAARPGARLHSRTERLTVRHRFGPQIGALADAILGNAPERAFGILSGAAVAAPGARSQASDTPPAVRWVETGTTAYEQLVEEAVAHARRLRSLAGAGSIEEAVAAQRDFQVLCAHRAGASGVTGWNASLEKRLGVAGSESWYPGRPLMVTRNNPAIDLFNGDVGLVVPGIVEGSVDAAFPSGDGVRRVPVSRLEEVATVHALTIHKSQGSEYRHAVVVLPDRPSRISTRELLYTGITRAIDRVTVVGPREVIEAAIRTPIRRATGLADRLA